MVCLFSCLCAAPYMCSGAGNGSDTVGNQTDRQPGSLFLWSYRHRAGTDEVLCVGSAFLKISLPQFLKIGIIAKIISVGMISFSGSFGVLCDLEHWQIIAAELLIMFLASAGLQYFCKEEDAKRNHERIYIDH